MIRVLAICGSALLGACSPKFPEGSSRPVESYGRAGIVSCEGTEVVKRGQWVKHGDFIFRDPDKGAEIARGAYVNGLEHGPWTKTGDDGIIGHGHFVSGQRHGDWTYTYPSGETESQGAYVEGRRHGTWKIWGRDGTLALEKDYDMGRVLVAGDDPPNAKR